MTATAWVWKQVAGGVGGLGRPSLSAAHPGPNAGTTLLALAHLTDQQASGNHPLVWWSTDEISRLTGWAKSTTVLHLRGLAEDRLVLRSRNQRGRYWRIHPAWLTGREAR